MKSEKLEEATMLALQGKLKLEEDINNDINDIISKYDRGDLDLSSKERMTGIYNTVIEGKKDLQRQFENITENDKNLKNYFNGDTRYTNITYAEAVLGGVALRNLQRENGNMSGDRENYPYSDEQLDIIDKHTKLGEILNYLDAQAENSLEESADNEVNSNDFQTECKELEDKLDTELKNVMDDNKDMHIKAARKQAIKNLGLEEVNPYGRKGYYEPKDCLRWGSKAGYDDIYFVRVPKK